MPHKIESLTCPIHGKPTKRQSCRECNAAYMRIYMRQRRVEAPERTLWERARRRARGRSVKFSLTLNSIQIPAFCPALGIPIVLGESRSSQSPSLDRIVPCRGYVAGNVRVISDKANRLKGALSLEELRQRSISGPPQHRADYALIAAYVDRERLISEIRLKASKGGRAGAEWNNIADCLERLFSRRPPDEGEDM